MSKKDTLTLALKYLEKYSHFGQNKNIREAVEFISDKLKTVDLKPVLDLNFILKLHLIVTKDISEIETKGCLINEFTKRKMSKFWDDENYNIYCSEGYCTENSDFAPNDEAKDLLFIGVNQVNESKLSPERFFFWFIFTFPFEYESSTIGKLLLMYLKNKIILYDEDFEYELLGGLSWKNFLWSRDPSVIYMIKDLDSGAEFILAKTIGELV